LCKTLRNNFCIHKNYIINKFNISIFFSLSMAAENLTAQKENISIHPVRIVSVFGLDESAISRHLTEFKQLFPQFKLRLQAKFPIIRVKLYNRGPKIDKQSISIEDTVRWVRRRLGDYVFSDSGESMEQVGVTNTFKDLNNKAESIPFVDSFSFDLDQYVTDKALSGLFVMLAAEEKKIRDDPAARVTDLLKKVFANR